MFTYVSPLRLETFTIGPLRFQVVDLVIQMFVCQRGDNCISTIALWKKHRVVWDFLCTKNDVNNKLFPLLIWDKSPILSQTLIPIMWQCISISLSPIHTFFRESWFCRFQCHFQIYMVGFNCIINILANIWEIMISHYSHFAFWHPFWNNIWSKRLNI
jgi:hypothetical protein